MSEREAGHCACASGAPRHRSVCKHNKKVAELLDDFIPADDRAPSIIGDIVIIIATFQPTQQH